MMWWVVLVCLLGFSQAIGISIHPIRMCVKIVGFGLISCIGMNFFVGPLFSVSYFLVLLSGVLVVFAYSVALVPITSMEEGSDKWTKVKNFVLTFVILFIFVFLSWGSNNHFSSSTYYSECFYLNSGWGNMMVFLSIFLFLLMILCASICKTYKGPLVK